MELPFKADFTIDGKEVWVCDDSLPTLPHFIVASYSYTRFGDSWKSGQSLLYEDGWDSSVSPWHWATPEQALEHAASLAGKPAKYDPWV